MICYPSHFPFLVSTVAAIHIPITVMYNFSFSLLQFTILNCLIIFHLYVFFVFNGEIELTKKKGFLYQHEFEQKCHIGYLMYYI